MTITLGLRQRYVLFSVLLNSVLERVIPGMNISKGVSLGRTTIGYFAHADHIPLLGKDKYMVKLLGNKLI